MLHVPARARARASRGARGRAADCEGELVNLQHRSTCNRQTDITKPAPGGDDDAAGNDANDECLFPGRSDANPTF
eukprot:1016410-Pyramimonas_sp.AAC.1